MDYSDCIKSLMKTEVSPALLAQCDGIVFEGSGLILSQLCTIPDQAMKHPMNNALKMGVKLVISNWDPFQLQAIKLDSIWLSTHIIF